MARDGAIHLQYVAGAPLDVDVRACRPEDLASWLEEGNEAIVAGPLGPGRIVLEDRAVVVNVFPNDLKLPELQHLADAAKHLADFLARVLKRPMWDAVHRLASVGAVSLRVEPPDTAGSTATERVVALHGEPPTLLERAALFRRRARRRERSASMSAAGATVTGKKLEEVLAEVVTQVKKLLEPEAGASSEL